MKNLCLFLSTLSLVFSASAFSQTAGTPPTASAPAASGPSYSGEALQLKNRLVELFEKSKNVNAKAAKRSEARAAIENALDWDKIAKDCLPDGEYAKAGSKNVSEFKSLLKDVIVRTAYTRLDTFWKGAVYQFPEIKVTGDKAHAKAVFTIQDKEGNEEFSLDYYLSKRGDGKWMIYDIAFEEVRYSENIREQIKTFLGEKGFSSLLGKLRERRKELVESEAKG